MAKRSVSTTNITLTAFADGAVNMTDGTYCGVVQGASSTQKTAIIEVYCGGQSASSAVAIMLLARDGQIGTGSTAGLTTFDAALDPATAALAAPVLTSNVWATNKPQRSATLHLLNLTFNAFGGIVRWVAAPGEEVYVVGNTASLGEASLSCFTGGSGIVGTHMIYETA